MAQVVGFPWGDLPALQAADRREQTRLRRAGRRAFACENALAAARALLTSDVAVTLMGVSLSEPPPLVEHSVLLVGADERALVVVEPEPDLVALALTRLLGRPVRLPSPSAPIESALRGALTALVLELARRAAKAQPFRVLTETPQPMPQRGLMIDMASVLDGRRFRTRVWFWSANEPGGASEDFLQNLGLFGSMPLGVPLVVGEAVTNLNDLRALSPGDVWLSRNGMWIDENLHGTGTLSAPNANRGVAVDVSRERIVLKGTRVAHMTEAQTKPDELALGETLADVPVVVRVELAAVTLPAAEWAELRPGDVVQTGKSVGGPVTLRVAGQAIAHGELVSVEGELGVRITSLSETKQP